MEKEPAPRKIVSSRHLATTGGWQLSEFEFGLIVAYNGFSRWVNRCMAASGHPTLGTLEVLVLHNINHRDRGKRLSDATGDVTNTGGTLDLAIDGPGFFMVETPEGERLTRAGSFLSNGEGDLVTLTGHRVLDAGGAPIFVPSAGGSIAISKDGTISIEGRPVAQIGIYEVENPQMLTREGGVLFRSEDDPFPAETSRVQQGFLEGSNVDAVTEMARLIEVQRAYELGQNLLDSEDERIRSSIRTLGSAN